MPPACWIRLRTSFGSRTWSVEARRGSDVIHGSPGADVIVGLGGGDLLFREGGNDTICGDAGSDYLVGGPGDDKVAGEESDDVIEGQEGNDTLRGFDGRDTLRGGVGNDTLDGGDAHDFTRDWGDDNLGGDQGADVMRGSGGDDLIIGEESGAYSRDRLYGFDGNDRLSARDGVANDKMWGGGGNGSCAGDSDEAQSDCENGQFADQRVAGDDPPESQATRWLHPLGRSWQPCPRQWAFVDQKR